MILSLCVCVFVCVFITTSGELVSGYILHMQHNKAQIFLVYVKMVFFFFIIIIHLYYLWADTLQMTSSPPVLQSYNFNVVFLIVYLFLLYCVCVLLSSM